jgi:hypothetical protein
MPSRQLSTADRRRRRKKDLPSELVVERARQHLEPLAHQITAVYSEMPMRGTSFHGRRKPKGSACQRRTIAGVPG